MPALDSCVSSVRIELGRFSERVVLWGFFVDLTVNEMSLLFITWWVAHDVGVS
jgi:hypothetical protein